MSYKSISGAVQNLREQTKDSANVRVFFKPEKGRTFEYDLAWENKGNPLLFTDDVEVTEIEALVNSLWESEDKDRAKFASSFLIYAEGRKGELAFELVSGLQENKNAEINVPQHIKEALQWACHKEILEEANE
ncbi:hypothetical protein [Paenibacillus vortex]|uniref:hypothetical protein n=1 Tax=Paenibacillus vortex TaxID=71995 RepID=UPI0003046DDB|nr:hypothetical protein [Paenibacillus vortex]